MGTTPPNSYPPERRTQPTEVERLMRQVLLGMEHLETSLKNEIRQIAMDAFPEGDAAGHKRYHLASIKAAENKAAFWDKMQFELVRWGLIGFLGWAAYQLWAAFLHGPK